MRYFQPTLKDYTSSFVPTELPFELMLKSLDNKQAAYDKAQADIDTTGDLFKVNKGLNYASTWGEADIAKPFRDQLETINNDLATGKKQPAQAARDVINLKRQFDQNKDIKAANLDYSLTGPWMQARLKDPNAIGTLYNGKGINPQNISGLSDAEISNLYSMQGRGQFEEEHKELASTLRDEISQKNYEEYKRRSGGIEPKINTSTGMIETTHGNPLLAKEINAKTAYEVFDRYAKANFNSSNKESVKYMQMENNIGLANNTPESYRDRLYNTFSGLYGIHDLSGGYNKGLTQLSGNYGNNNNDQNVQKPLSITTLGTTQKIGFDRDKTKSETFLSSTMRGISKVTEHPLTKKDAILEESQFKNLDDNTKRIVHNYIKEYGVDKHWSHLLDSKGNLKVNDLPQGTLKKLYDEIESLNKIGADQILFQNQTAEPISFISPTSNGERLTPQQEHNKAIWVSHFGNNPTVDLKDIVNNPVTGNTIIRLSDMKQMKSSDFKEEELNSKIPNVIKYTPDNLLPIMTGDKSFKSGLGFKVGDESYIIRDISADNTDIMINDLYNELAVNHNQFINVPTIGKLKLNSNNKIEYKIGKDIQEFNSLPELIYQLKSNKQ